jgi:hypothetical protein
MSRASAMTVLDVIAQHVQVIDMADECRIAVSARSGEIHGGTARKGDQLFGGSFGYTRACNRGHLRRTVQGFRGE